MQKQGGFISVFTIGNRRGLRRAAAITTGFLLVGAIFAASASAAAPANDNFANAQTLTGLDTSASGTTAESTLEAGEPDHCSTSLECPGFEGTHSVWYSWTAPGSGSTTIDTCTAAIDSVLAVYTGSALNALTRVVDANNFCASGFGSKVTFNATGGTTYRTAVGDCCGAQANTFTINVDGSPPPNDNFANAAVLTGLDTQANGSTAGATFEAGEVNPCQFSADCAIVNAGLHTVWYSWTAPGSGSTTIDTCTAMIDSQLAVYTGSWPGLTRIVDVNNGCPSGFGSKLSLEATGGTTYWIGVDDCCGARQNIFTLVIDGSPPPNDDFVDAELLTGHDATANGSTAGGTQETNEPEHCVLGPDCSFGYGHHSVWYRWTAPFSGPTTIDSCAAMMDSQLAVYTGSDVAALTRLVDVNNGCPSGFGSKATLEATAGTEYKIAVDDCCGAQQNIFTVSVDGIDGPPNSRIDHGPKRKTKRKRATFEFSSIPGGASFQCSLDGAAFAACSSPMTVRVKRGKHTFRVRAKDEFGNIDRSPAEHHWKVKKKRRRR
jgi:hypothetical protein